MRSTAAASRRAAALPPLDAHSARRALAASSPTGPTCLAGAAAGAGQTAFPRGPRRRRASGSPLGRINAFFKRRDGLARERRRQKALQRDAAENYQHKFGKAQPLLAWARTCV